MIAYQRALRFGYKEVLKAFEGIINNACINAKLKYKFCLNQYTEGLDLDQLTRELQNQGPVQKINIKYQIPNPESDLLSEIRINREKTIADFASANLTVKNVMYQTNSERGINLESDIIKEELKNISNMHSKIDAKKAIQNGYVVVETTDINGLTKSSADMRPIIKHIEEYKDFGEEAKISIMNVVVKEIQVDQ